MLCEVSSLPGHRAQSTYTKLCWNPNLWTDQGQVPWGWGLKLPQTALNRSSNQQKIRDEPSGSTGRKKHVCECHRFLMSSQRLQKSKYVGIYKCSRHNCLLLPKPNKQSKITTQQKQGFIPSSVCPVQNPLDVPVHSTLSAVLCTIWIMYHELHQAPYDGRSQWFSGACLQSWYDMDIGANRNAPPELSSASNPHTTLTCRKPEGH